MHVSTSTARHTRDLRSPALTAAAMAVGTLILALRSPHGGGYGMCPILALTGYLCPTCGGLRAVHDLAHLDFAGAWAMNPLLTILLPLIGLLTIGWLWRAWRGYPARPIPGSVVVAIAIVTVVFGIARNF